MLTCKNRNGGLATWFAGWLAAVWPLIAFSAFPATAQDPPQDVTVTFSPLITGLQEPLGIVDPGDGSGRLFIVEHGGRILIWNGAALSATPFLDIGALTTADGERGLLGLTFHPEFSLNGRFFIHYTDLSGNTVLAGYTVSADPDQADPASAEVILRVTQPFANHNGGEIRFGPDGFLYMGLGDGGSGGDPMNNAQDLGSLLGKLLRLDVDNGMPYGIPADNPFIGQPGARPEIWAYGLRNPWRFSFDRATGDLFIADVGQNRFEEIDFQSAAAAGGENYGWRLMEASACFDPPLNCDPGGDLVPPIIEYGRDTGQSVTGGFRYRGSRIPELAGRYVFADFSTGRIFVATEAPGNTWDTVIAAETGMPISTMGEDAAGELYFAHFSSIDGRILRIESAQVSAAAAEPAPPADTGSGSSGCFLMALSRDE